LEFRIPALVGVAGLAGGEADAILVSGLKLEGPMTLTARNLKV